MAKAFFGIALWLCLALPLLAAPPAKKQPNWAELTPAQQTVLAPLQTRWDRLSGQRKAMWLGIAQAYPSMSPDDQKKVQRRLQRWVKLTPDERKTVRQSYRSLQQLPPERKKTLKEEWDAYNQLPEEERRKLRTAKPPPKSAKSSPAQKKPAPSSSSPAATPAPAPAVPAASTQ